MNIDTGDVLALLALALSGFATWKTLQFNGRQESLIESQESLNRRLTQREDNEDREARQAVLSAAFIKLGSSWKLRIGNKGKSSARNVRISVIAGGDSFISSDVESKFPMQVLHPYQSVDLLAAVGFGTLSKYEILFEWEDDYQTHNQTTVFPTI